MTTISEQFIHIMPRHQRLLAALFEQRKYDPFGGIGWRALMDEDEQFTPEQLFGPLLERGLIEDLTEAHKMASGKYFVHITALGIACMNFGQMLREPRRPDSHELKQLTATENNREPQQAQQALRPQQPKTIEAGNPTGEAAT
jgi:hypothetical protein